VFAWWPTPVPLLAGVALTGVAAVLFQVSAPPFMMQHSEPTARDHLFSANAAINIGLAGVGSLLAGYLPALFGRLLGTGPESVIAYRATFAVAAAGLALSIVPLLLIRRYAGEVPEQEKPAETANRLDTPPRKLLSSRLRLSDLLERIPASWRILARHPGPLLRLLIPPFLISWGAALLIPYLNLYFKESFAISDQVLGQIFAALGVTTGLAALIGPMISRRIGKIGTVALTQLLSIPFLLMLGFMPLLYVAIGAALMRAALFNAGSPLYDAFAMERTEDHARPLVIGLINGAYSVGYLAAPQISTFVQERYGFQPLFVVTATCYSFAALANYWLFIRPERKRPRSTP
jgi:MFS family permease